MLHYYRKKHIFLVFSTSQSMLLATARTLKNTIAFGRDILEVGVGGNPKVGGFSNLGFYRPGQRIGDEAMIVIGKIYQVWVFEYYSITPSTLFKTRRTLGFRLVKP